MTDKRIGDFIQTFTGGCFWPLDPRPDEVFVADIAHALSMKCRWGGHSKRFYSVAEHSVLISFHVPSHVALWGLLHDAAEAYSADIPSPLKQNLTGWQPMEDRIMEAVCVRFNLPMTEPAIVKSFDIAICADERAAFMAPCQREWAALPAPIGANIRCLSPTVAEGMFLDRFAALTGTASIYDGPAPVRISQAGGHFIG
jgi:uncharacterized protein